MLRAIYSILAKYHPERYRIQRLGMEPKIRYGLKTVLEERGEIILAGKKNTGPNYFPLDIKLKKLCQRLAELLSAYTR
ncbi:hypothetical protein [Echinicola pacifica]|nr:hypothetical protein [Echinicola pacifica]